MIFIVLNDIYLTTQGELNMTKLSNRNTRKPITINMAASASVEISQADEQAILASMLEEIIEQDDDTVAVIAPVVAEEHEIAAAVADLEKAEAIEAIYAEDGTVGITDGEAPLTSADADVKPKKEKKAKVAKEPKEPKAPRATSVTHKAGDLLMFKLGDKAKDFLLFETDDITIGAANLNAKIDAFIARMNVLDKDSEDYIADKVREKAIMLFTWMKNGGVLNEVLTRTFKVLAKDGELTSGIKGNLQVDLLSKPYSPGTAASQANQMFMLLPLLNITMKEKGKMVANPDSLILMKANAELGLV
jgi:hypothetical protein